jgi:prepilin-type N-terminal cleavage/methylation domain-containing protein
MKWQNGFTLAEMAIVLLIIGLLLGGLLTPLSVQTDIRRIGETQKELDQAREALIGFAAANGRLPCPAAPGTTGVESPVGGGVCTNAFNGFLPASTLGITPTDSQGYAIDAWGQRIRYAVSNSNTSALTTTNGIKNTTMATISATNHLYICATATGITATTCGTAVSLSDKAPAIIFSLGKNYSLGGAGIDETANLNGDRVFVSHDMAATTAPNGEFDDIVTWPSLNVLYNRMIAAGQLP